MPPKNDKAAKKVADATFGLKNKSKSKKVQNFIEQIQKSANSSAAAKEAEARREQKAREKMLKEQHQADMASLFKPVVAQQKLATGTDPKSVVCEFFKKGTCTKGNKCKFSHVYRFYVLPGIVRTGKVAERVLRLIFIQIQEKRIKLLKRQNLLLLVPLRLKLYAGTF